MSRLTIVSVDGAAVELDVADGMSVMKAAVNNRVRGIVGECGGGMQCSTCHVYVDEATTIALPPISEDEEEMLEATAAPRTEHSRLSCQLRCSAATDGLLVHAPATQF